MMKCLSYKSHQKCPPVTTIGGIYVVDLWISVPETCSNMQKSCLLLRSQHVTVLSKSCESCKWASINYVTLGGNESIDSTDTQLMWKNIYFKISKIPSSVLFSRYFSTLLYLKSYFSTVVFT